MLVYNNKTNETEYILSFLNAYEIIEMIVLMINKGSWRGVSKRKKFKLDFCNENDSFDDHFYIGLSLKHNMKL